jgi:AbrB family looped-hinge helix DNA binding protein
VRIVSGAMSPVRHACGGRDPRGNWPAEPANWDGRRPAAHPPLGSGWVRRYLTRMKTTVSTKGQIVLPAELRQQDGIEAGQEFEVERIDRGEYLLKRKEPRRNEGLLELLLACPVKGWFKPMDRSETTDDIDGSKLG